MNRVFVKEVLQFAIETDMIQLAHRIFWAVVNGKVQLDDDAEQLEVIDYDVEAISAMVEENKLQIGKIKLYVAEMKEPDLFSFYYSENILEAHALHQDLFRETPKRLTNASHLMKKLFHFDETSAADILYFHRTKVVAYPYYLGYARAGERVLRRGGPLCALFRKRSDRK
ncbi:hypothetical protein [Sporosarcina sp. HYO08]|uniref:hypothetical protein n=1 Tax=Sporosarcina sp. HYO08 TaxID=1759557 RepID=UPI00079712F0|nr:hypothetical protein [Sporosarcina sp. HYO08]KXH86953.1 hypothetical protein AU377_13480 [Sporosarcina sp. HYO08]